LKRKDSAKNLILYRGPSCAVIMNKYPYNTGHLMVIPIRHISQLEKLTRDEAANFFTLIQQSVAIIKKTLAPQSLNVGMNLGRSAGAGIPGHLHMHIVPRWRGDTNFMPVIGKTHVVSIPLEPIYKKLKAEYDRL
jgi:ATP adenylyltransferase